MEYTKLDVEKIMTLNPETKEIVVPEGVTEIGKGAFYDAKNTLEKVVLPSSLMKIGKSAFERCEKLTEIDLPSNLAEIEESAFEECGLKSLVCPKGLKKIDRYAFLRCKELASVKLNEGLESINNAFSECEALKEIKLPESLANGDFSFSYCTALEKVELPKGLTEIPSLAFRDCESLKEIEIPAGVKKINLGAFGSVALESIELPSGIEEIGDRAFSKCKLTAIELPKSLKKIESSAFSGNNIESVAFPSGIEIVGGFDNNPLKSVEIPEGVSEIGSSAFANCKSLESVKLPSTLKQISSRAFEKCENLEVITLGGNVTEIGEEAFKGCTALKEIKLPKSLKRLGSRVFKGCTSLSEIEIPENVEESRFTFYMFFVDSSVKKVRWLTNAEAKNCCFGGSPFLEEVYVNASTIKKEAFYIDNLNSRDAKIQNCPALKKLVIGKDVEKIEDGAFFGLYNLTEIVLEEGNTKYIFESGSLYAKSTKRLVRAVPVGEKDGKKLYQIAKKVKAIGEGAFPRSVEEAEVEFLGKIEKVNDKAVDGYSKGSWKKENQIENAKGGAKIVYDAMNFVNAKEAKIEAVKKASADALVTAALSNWQYGFDEANGYAPARKVYRVKLPFDAAFIINMKTKPTQKDAQTVFDTINSLKEITDEAALFEKVRDFSAKSDISVKGSNRELKLIEFSGLNNYGDAANVKSAQGLPPNDFIEKDIASFFEESSLMWQMSIIADSYSTKEKPYMPKVEIAIKKNSKIISIVWNHWSIFENAKGNERTELASLISIVKDTETDNLESAFKESKFPKSNGVLVFSE